MCKCMYMYACIYVMMIEKQRTRVQIHIYMREYLCFCFDWGRVKFTIRFAGSLGCGA